ncbi:hypothetical protein [Acanthopleuribacter pedis]|uniref:Uncharacterized protein n=1 Tax=Acanthopleuribacter pedis TaxID=442870 RepID=A0A8J7U1F6_9BACT|nr:hypothetical protein [Acanthopleuribacter pedis]MBO1317462.1 hypothetical protein [Acanthopleuribacter pedis]
MSSVLHGRTHLLLHRLLDNRIGPRALLKNNIGFGVRMACMLASIHFVWMFRQLAGMVSDFSFIYRGFVFATACLGLGFAISAFCKWAHHALERRIENLHGELHGALAACCDQIIQSGEPASNRSAKPHQPTRGLALRPRSRPAWLQFPIVTILVLVFAYLLMPYARGQRGFDLNKPPMASARFLSPWESRLVVYLNHDGLMRINRLGLRPYLLKPEDFAEEAQAWRKAGITNCVLMADQETKIHRIFAIQEQLRVAGFEKIIYGDEVHLFP